MALRHLNTKKQLLLQGELLNDFTWHFVQDYEHLARLQEHMLLSLKNSKENYPYYEMVCAMIEMLRTGMEISQEE